jgi:hypothetical protein
VLYSECFYSYHIFGHSNLHVLNRGLLCIFRILEGGNGEQSGCMTKCQYVEGLAIYVFNLPNITKVSLRTNFDLFYLFVTVVATAFKISTPPAHLQKSLSLLMFKTEWFPSNQTHGARQPLHICLSKKPSCSMSAQRELTTYKKAQHIGTFPTENC